MKPGVRALGVAESYGARTDDGRPDRSTLAGVVCRADGTVDGFAFGSCTVGGLDSTEAAIDLHERLDREDVQYVLVAGVALAWYNLLDLTAVHEATDLPVIAVTFEDSDGLEPALADAFDGVALDRRLDRYRALPPRTEYGTDQGSLFLRSVGVDDPDVVIDHFSRAGRRPEPVRVARQAARAADRWQRDER